METMKASNGDFKAELVGANVECVVATAGSTPPTLQAVAAALRTTAGVLGCLIMCVSFQISHV